MADLNAMALFARIAERGSFTAAARDLGMSKSAVSKNLGALEARLGVRLLHRTTRRLSLTEAGARFLEGCERALAAAEEAERAAGALAAAPRGTVRVNAPVSFGIRHVSRVLPGFLERYPEIRVELDLLDRRVDPVEEGYDLTIRVGRLADSSLIARRLAPNAHAVCAAPSYLAAHGVPERPEDLRRHHCLIYAYLATGRSWRFVGPDGETRRIPVSGPLVANNGDLLEAVACAGRGITLAPTFLCAEDIAAGRLVPLLPGWTPDPGGAVHALFHESRDLLPKVRVMVGYLAEVFGPEPYWDRKIAAAVSSPRAATRR